MTKIIVSFTLFVAVTTAAVLAADGAATAQREAVTARNQVLLHQLDQLGNKY